MSRQGSSLPEGARMVAASRLRSVSAIFRDTSVEVPTLSWDVRMESSPAEMPSAGHEPEVDDKMDRTPMTME